LLVGERQLNFSGGGAQELTWRRGEMGSGVGSRCLNFFGKGNVVITTSLVISGTRESEKVFKEALLSYFVPAPSSSYERIILQLSKVYISIN
jgi:hypothetical protein